MKKGSILMVALAGMIIAGGMLKAGEVGTVTIPKVIEVNAVGTGTATDGTGGYKPSHGVGTGSLKKKVTVSGNEFTYSASGTPSSSVDDSAVTITYKGPAVSEEEKSVTAKCTVVKLTIEEAAVEAFEPVIRGNRYHYVIIFVSGQAKPAGLGNVLISSVPTSGEWTRGSGVGYPENYFTLYSMEKIDGRTSMGIRFDIDVEYAGIKKSKFRISKAALAHWFLKWLLSLLYS